MRETSGTLSLSAGSADVYWQPGAFYRSSVCAGGSNISISGRLPKRGCGISARPSWSCIFMKAYALVGAGACSPAAVAAGIPWPRLYEHPWMNCAVAIERMYQGEEGVFVGIFWAPERQTLCELKEAVAWYKNETLEKVGFYRMALRFSRVPAPLAPIVVVGHAEYVGPESTASGLGRSACRAMEHRGRADSSDFAAFDHAHVWPD